MKLGRDDVLMVPYKCCCFSARSAQGRIQGGTKIGHGGPLLQETSSSDWKATAANQMDSNDLEACGKKCCYFWFHSEVKFLTCFWRLFRAQEPKAPVTYCDHALSGVRRPASVCRPSSVRLFTFSTSSPEPLDGFWWNLVWMKYSRSLTSVVVFRPDPSRGGSRAGQK